MAWPQRPSQHSIHSHQRALQGTIKQQQRVVASWKISGLSLLWRGRYGSSLQWAFRFLAAEINCHFEVAAKRIFSNLIDPSSVSLVQRCDELASPLSRLRQVFSSEGRCSASQRRTPQFE